MICLKSILKHCLLTDTWLLFIRVIRETELKALVGRDFYRISTNSLASCRLILAHILENYMTTILRDASAHKNDHILIWVIERRWNIEYD